MKDYVRIQSTMTINVTPGLQLTNSTNKDSDIPNRMKVSPTWTNAVVKIMEGAHDYPSEIVEWPTVKALVRDKILTIGEYKDIPEETETAIAKSKLEEGLEVIKQRSTPSKKEKKEKSVSLDELAE